MSSLTEDPAAALDALEAAIRTAESASEVAALVARIQALTSAVAAEAWEPYPWQTPPGEIPTQGTWLQMGGRGTGKTEGACRYVDDHVNGPPCDRRVPGGHRVIIVAPTQGDAVEACFRGPSGLGILNPATRMKGGAGGLAIHWPNGGTARLLGAHTPDDVERLRATSNHCLAYLEEAAAMRYLGEARTHTRLGLRLGHHPHMIAATTPKPRIDLREWIAEPDVLITKGTTYEAHHLDEAVRATYLRIHGGTRLGKQELEAELLDDIEGALWTVRVINDHRIHDGTPVLPRLRYAVGVDPSGSTTGGAEVGIVVVGSANGHGWVVEDLSGHYTPEGWARVAVRAAKRYNCGLAVEKTYGQKMVDAVLRTAPGGGAIDLLPAPTKVGKALRAEPVVSLYEQGRIHHVGTHADLETQMTTWVPGEGDSPDRVDALVHAVTYLLVEARAGERYNPARSDVRVPGSMERLRGHPGGGPRIPGR